MRTLKLGDIVESLIDDTFTLKGVTYKTLIKGAHYKVIAIHPWEQANNDVELEPVNEPDVSVYAKPSELKLVSEGVAA